MVLIFVLYFRLCCLVDFSDRIVLDGWIVLAVSYRWIVSTGLAGLDQLDWIGSYRLDEDTYFMHWLVTARMRRTDWMGCWWDWGGTDGR